MNFESSKKRSASHSSHGGQVDITKTEAEEEGEGTQVEKRITTSKAEKLQQSVFKNMKAISKQKGEVGE
eukprot:7378655-Ditylum_brightwellii.AAC.1